MCRLSRNSESLNLLQACGSDQIRTGIYFTSAFQRCRISKSREIWWLQQKPQCTSIYEAQKIWKRCVSCQNTSNAPDEHCVFLSIALSHPPWIEWVTQVTLDSCHNFWMQFSTWDCSWLNLQWMKSVGKRNGETHFEDRDGVYDMGREEAQFLELTHVLRITQLRRTSGTCTRIKQNFVSKKKKNVVRMYICINKPIATLNVIGWRGEWLRLYSVGDWRMN